MPLLLHPLLDNGIKKGSPSFQGGTLTCLCPTAKVTLTISSPPLHNHACACSQCYKPPHSILSLIAVVPTPSIKITNNAHKLKLLDPNATILRWACVSCEAHMYGSVEKPHAFWGLSFIHPELFVEGGWPEPTFAAFLPSLVENGVVEGGVGIARVRERLGELGLVGYDALNPPLMEALAAFDAAEKARL